MPYFVDGFALGMQYPAVFSLLDWGEWRLWGILGVGILLGNLVQWCFHRLQSRLIRCPAVEGDRELSSLEIGKILTALNDVVLVLDREGRYLKIAPTQAPQLYRPAAEVIGKTLADLFDSDRAQFFLKHIHQTLDTQQPVRIEYTLPIAGQLVWFAAKLLPLDLDRVLCVAQDITDQKQAANAICLLNSQLEQRVQERTQALEVANQELEAFCYSVSHDLRSPLRRIAGFSQAILEDCADELNPISQSYLQRAIHSTERMEEMIDDLLSLSHLSLQELNAQWVDLSAIALQIARELQQTNPSRPVEFKIAPQAIAYADARLLQIALENLLENAWKYTSKQAAASIEFGILPHTLPWQPRLEETRSLDSQYRLRSPEPQTLTFFIRDNGIGFNPHYASKLFAPFQRLHNAQEFEGTGIGLAIVQRIIHRHSGRVWAQAAPEQGATFFFCLPFNPTDPELPRVTLGHLALPPESKSRSQP
ncbi:sensor histidine kinase [Geitlerinema calcuttense]|uniref:histidine kinase n=1 Tax=Geitlerinema calcuttense NRMC-F 0142 TaxID=2922238 RepID=A0ABT7M065_9CYAN|nr:ATP-binding protein [Geitlerinema calcuttense]MDL5057655.1 ATP-binding protein [Geitlerinema calcuttense NRMC-F 0142]